MKLSASSKTALVDAPEKVLELKASVAFSALVEVATPVTVDSKANTEASRTLTVAPALDVAAKT